MAQSKDSVTQAADSYVPPDPTQIEASKPEALLYWAKTLETGEEKIRQAVRKAGPLLEDVKKELGIAGV